jgi:hypothetical protein
MTVRKASLMGARRVTASLDRIATLFESHAASLGIPAHVAKDFSVRCDLLSSTIDRNFGLKTAGYYNPAQIGEGVPGPMIMDANNPFMNGHFTQAKFTQLAEKQLSGSLAGNAAAHRADPKLASLIAKTAAVIAFEQLKEWDLANRKAAAKKAAEEEEEKKSEEEEEPKKEAKKADEGDEGDEDEETASDEEDAKKTASLFGLFSDAK